jgi:hypothetical protein
VLMLLYQRTLTPFKRKPRLMGGPARRVVGLALFLGGLGKSY